MPMYLLHWRKDSETRGNSLDALTQRTADWTVRQVVVQVNPLVCRSNLSRELLHDSFRAIRGIGRDLLYILSRYGFHNPTLKSLPRYRKLTAV